MIKSNLKGKDLITTRDWSVQDLFQVLELAEEMQKKRFAPEFSCILQNKSFLMLFYSPSAMTQQSFEVAAGELGAQALFLDPSTIRGEDKKSKKETTEDTVKVMERFGCGLGMRILEDKITDYGEGEKILRKYAKYCRIPIISMGHDKYNPCQGLAELMAYRKHLAEGLKGKTILHTWGHGTHVHSPCSVQESILISSRLGMNVSLAHPPGYSLDEEVVRAAKKKCSENGGEFLMTNDPVEAYQGADVVYSKNWMSREAYAGGEFDKQKELKKALKFSKWICNKEKIKLTNNALFSSPMPVDRGHEVTDAVVSGNGSIIYDIAENRLHVQKAVMALTMSD